MNDRIKQLADEATSYANTLDVADQRIYQKIRDREFAELIVRECCLVLERTQTALDRHKWPTPSECGVYIKEHFGVES